MSDHLFQSDVSITAQEGRKGRAKDTLAERDSVSFPAFRFPFRLSRSIGAPGVGG